MVMGAAGQVTVWLNGRRVVTEVDSLLRRDQIQQDVQLRSGENEVVLKVMTWREANFIFRLSDLDGKPFGDLKIEP